MKISMENIKHQIKLFASSTSVKGVSRIEKSTDAFLKIIWSFAVAGSFAVSVVLLLELFQRFYQWPVSNRYAKEDSGKIIFPDVTLCSLNRYIGTKTFLTSQTFEYSQDNDKFQSISQSIARTNDCPRFIVECKFYINNLDLAGHCEDSFVQIRNGEYPWCGTLKGNLLRNGSGAAIVKGISLILDTGLQRTEQMSFDTFLTTSLAGGVVIAIHGSETRPAMKKSFALGPGTESFIKISQTNLKLLGSPYLKNGCTLQKNLSDSSHSAYSFDLCYDHCQQKKIFRECNCIDHRLDIPETFADAKICANASTSDELNKRMSCSRNASIKITECIDCKYPCDGVDYQYKVTSAPWPPLRFQLSFYRKYIKTCFERGALIIRKRFAAYEYFDEILQGNKSTSFNMSADGNYTFADLKEIDKSFMVIKMVMDDEGPYLLQETPFYTWDVMVCLVGGMLSLWLGISAMTFIELFELLYHMIRGFMKETKVTEEVPK